MQFDSDAAGVQSCRPDLGPLYGAEANDDRISAAVRSELENGG